MAQVLSTKRKQILDCISESVRDRGYPPSVRELSLIHISEPTRPY